MVAEKESTRGILCVSHICWPWRMCQPVPASRSKSRPSAPQLRPKSNARKKRSATEGIKNRRNCEEARWVPADRAGGSGADFVLWNFEGKLALALMPPCYAMREALRSNFLDVFRS